MTIDNMLSHKARADLKEILRETQIRHGQQQRQEYRRKIEYYCMYVQKQVQADRNIGVGFNSKLPHVLKYTIPSQRGKNTHSIIFDILPANKGIRVLRLYHSSRDLSRLFTSNEIKSLSKTAKTVPIKPLSPYEKRKLAEQQNKGKNTSRGR